MSTIAHFSHISFRYHKEKPLLDDLSLAIPKGKTTAIIGPNGCGKTTLLKLLSRLIKAQSGSIMIADKEIQSYRTTEFAKTVSFMSQQTLKVTLTAEQYVELGRLPHQKGLSPFYTKEDKEICASHLDVCGIAELRDQPLCEMSAGQRQLTSLAKQLVQDSELLLLDEPTANLDPKHQVELLSIVQSVVHTGRSAVIVLHDLNLASRFADHIVLMKKGAIVAEGTPHSVYDSGRLSNLYEADLEVVDVKGQQVVIHS